MEVFRELEEQIEAGAVDAVFFGKSVVQGNKRFATLRDKGGKSVSTGQGQTCTEALQVAVTRLSKPKPRKMPGM